MVLRRSDLMASFIKHFFPCDSTTIADSITGQEVSGVIGAVVGAAANSISFRVPATGSLDGAGWAPLAGNDMCMMVAGRAIDNSVAAGKTSIGNISFYMGNPSSGHYRVQPYLAGVEATDKTNDWHNLLCRREDVDYIFALVRRGTYLEHYVYDDIESAFVLAGLWEEDTAFNESPDNLTQFGHSSCGLPSGSASTTSDEPEDFYGAMVAHFPDGAPPPHEIIDAMNFHLNDATGWKSATKALYPSWLSGEYNMADTKISALTPLAAVTGAEPIPIVSGGATVSVDPEVLRSYVGVPWVGRDPGNAIISPVLGDLVPATSTSIIGSADAFHYIPFILTQEQAAAGLSSLSIKFLGNSGVSTNRLHIAVYDASDDTLLGEASRVIVPNSNAWALLNLPTIATYPQQIYLALSSGIDGGAGADCTVAKAILQSFPGFSGSTSVSNGVSAACAFAVASAWDTAPALSTIQVDNSSVSTMPFVVLIP